LKFTSLKAHHIELSLSIVVPYAEKGTVYNTGNFASFSTARVLPVIMKTEGVTAPTEMISDARKMLS